MTDALAHAPRKLSSTQTTDYYEVLRKPEKFTTPIPTVYLYSNENSAQRYGFGSKLAKERYPRLAEASARVTVGPMPPADFLEKFLPVSDEVLQAMPRSQNAFRDIKASNKKESHIYQALVRLQHVAAEAIFCSRVVSQLWALNADTSNKTRWLRHEARCPGFVFCDTSEHPDESGGSVGSVKPDIICYPDQYLPFVKVTKSSARPWEATARNERAESEEGERRRRQQVDSVEGLEQDAAAALGGWLQPGEVCRVMPLMSSGLIGQGPSLPPQLRKCWSH